MSVDDQTVEEPEFKRCPECGEVIAEDAPEGVCPSCLLLQGVSDFSGDAEKRESSRSIDVADIAPSFPKLKILENVGGGGMGTVFKAQQSGLERTVALKILTAGSSSLEFHERFLREARAMAKLSHPGIVTIHEFGEVDGFYYFIMEFVEGESLANRLRKGPIPPEESVGIVTAVSEALEFAHGKGIIHRDIKPGNILIGSDGSVKVADFGLAKLVLDDSADAFSLTMENQSIGTPFYMAPEQRVCSAKVDHRVDVYALGVVLYEMLTGKPPELDYDPPSETAGVDQGFNTLVRAATASDPDQRIVSAAAFRDQLKAINHDSHSSPAEDPLRKWGLLHVLKRRWWAFLLGAIMAAPIGLMIAAVATYTMPREYLGRVRLQIQPVSTDYEAFREDSTRAMLTPAYIQTQFQIITSEETLYEVVEELQLVQRWEVQTKSEAYNQLLEKIELKELRGTDLIDIAVYHTDPQEAADLANVIARTYKEQWQESNSQRIANAMERLRSQESLQEQEVEEARRQVANLEEELDLLRDNKDGEPSKELLTQYKAAKRNYKESAIILLDINQALLRTKEALSKEGIVIHEMAEPGEMPVRPKTTLMLLVGSAAGLIFLSIPAGIVSMYVFHRILRP